MIPQTSIHNAHTTMLQVQEELAEKYKYKALPPLLSILQREEYEKYFPEELRNYDGPLCTTKGTCICRKLTDRKYVCGDYGIYLEADRENMVLENVCIQKGQEFRITDPQYSEHVKYHWYTAKDTSGIKIYLQQRTVDYADYRPGMYYFSPYEIRICDGSFL